VKEVTVDGALVQIDDEDYDFVCELLNRGLLKYFKKGNRIMIMGLLHRILFRAKTHDPKIDHKDGNSLNNQKSNLRFASHIQNMANRKKSKGISKYKGVYWNKRNKKWKAQIKSNGKEIYLGVYEEEIDAAIAYDIKAKETWGEFARLNFDSINIEDNLRILSAQNHSKNKTTSKYLGVCFNKQKDKWRVSISKDKKWFHVGYFSSEREAASAYNKKAIELYGDQARMNIIE
jgi:hypothetical protein